MKKRVIADCQHSDFIERYLGDIIVNSKTQGVVKQGDFPRKI